MKFHSANILKKSVISLLFTLETSENVSVFFVLKEKKEAN